MMKPTNNDVRATATDLSGGRNRNGEFPRGLRRGDVGLEPFSNRQIANVAFDNSVGHLPDVLVLSLVCKNTGGGHPRFGAQVGSEERAGAAGGSSTPNVIKDR